MMDPLQIYTDYYIVHMVKKLKKKMKKEGMIFYSVPYEQVFEEVGVLKKIKRFAGTSVGSITALMVALGYTSQDTREVARMDLTKYFGQ